MADEVLWSYHTGDSGHTQELGMRRMGDPRDAEFIEWDESNEEHLAEHSIGPAEVQNVIEEAMTWAPNKKNRAGDWKVIGKTHGGRLLTIVVRYDEDRRCLRPITGWETTVGERKRYG